ncbi:hypothetical protein [Fischerella thermalis]|nr:hypothetical protein [Fischerella thermalis]
MERWEECQQLTERMRSRLVDLSRQGAFQNEEENNFMMISFLHDKL